MAVWIDSDLGFDDLWAILMVAREAEIAGLSLTFGVARLRQVEANAAGAAATFGWRFPIFRGADRALLGGCETAERILGPSGMATAGAELPKADLEVAGAAVDGLAAWLERAQQPRRVLALGPLTNIAVLQLARPDLARRIDEIVWMGGGVTSGNHTASAEFNAFADPEAVAILLARGTPLRMVDLDACRRVLVGPQDSARLRALAGVRARLLADLLEGYVSVATSRGSSMMAVYDPVAASVFLRRRLGAFRPARIEMELAGALTRGRTVVDQRVSAEPNAAFLADLEAEAVRAHCLDALEAEAVR